MKYEYEVDTDFTRCVYGICHAYICILSKCLSNKFFGEFERHDLIVLIIVYL